MENPKQKLKDIKKEKDFFIGIDSDGCVFDTMEIKQKECFCPKLIKHWELQKVQKYAREVWEFVNLYSKTRGLNRFLAVIETFKQLNERPDVQARNFQAPDLQPLTEWTQKETKLGNPALESYAGKVNNKIIDMALEWSVAVNKEVSEMVYGMPPFPYVREVLEIIRVKADMIVVSQTPIEALEREWQENELDAYAKIIAGQEYGTKAEHLEYTTAGKYDKDKILMVGDAPGDLKAAKSNNVLFFPINPGHEEESWERFYSKALDKFFGA